MFGVAALPTLFAAALVCVLAVFGIAVAWAQPVSEWSATLGGDEDEFAHAVALASGPNDSVSGGGFVIAGETRSYGSGSQDGWLVKLNADGEEQWSRTFGGTESDIIYSVQATSDGGYILAGETHSAEGASADSSHFWLVKTDSLGQEQWQSSYGSATGSGSTATGDSDVAHAVRQTSDGGFILVGSSTGTEGTSVRLARADSQGALLWSQELKDISGGVGYGVAEVSGGFIVAGSASSEDQGSQAFLAETDASGDGLWAEYFGGSYNDEVRSLAIADDGGYALGGFTWSEGAGQSDFWLLKVDRYGEQEWERAFGGVLRDAAHSVIKTSDNGFALAGWSESFRGGDRLWVVKTDADGRLQWSSSQQTASDSSDPALNPVSAGGRAIRQTASGGFAVAGWSGTIRGARDVMAVLLGPVSAGQATPAGAVVSLKNRGTSNITTAAVGFDTASGGNPIRFWYEGRLVDRDNPLPTGETACTQPSPALSADSKLSLDQIGSFETVYLDILSSGGGYGRVSNPPLRVDGDEIEFDFTDDGSGIAGSLGVVSTSPCERSSQVLPEGPQSPEGLRGEASDSHPGTITLEWDDSAESDIFGYAVYVSRSSNGPFVRQAWLLSDSAYADGFGTGGFQTRPYYGDRGATDGASYYYTVAAINSWGLESPKSAVLRVPSQDFTPPEPPSGLSVEVADRSPDFETLSAQLSWNASPSADLSGYRVYRQGEEGPRSPVTALLFAPEFEDRTLPQEGEFSYSVTAIDLSGNESDWSNISPEPLDFFGSVLEVRRNFTGGGGLSISTDRGRVDIAVASDTEIKVPNRSNAGLADLDIGDYVAVSLKEDAQQAVARQVHLVPSKTRNRHLAGRVTTLSESEIVVQPPGEGTEAVTFQLSETVRINLHQGASSLAQGRFVVVSFIATEGQDAGALTEINVIPGLEVEESGEPPDEPTNVAVIRGIFQGINADNANLILSSTEVAIDVDTLMTAGISVGDSVLVEAVLRDDASLLARRVEHDEGVGHTAARTVIRGVFQGRDAETGEWEVSGARITVDSRTYADALPAVGQRVKVTGIFRDDDRLYAREIENFPETVDLEGEHSVSLEGIFREIAAGGAGLGSWNVGGIPVQVDADTVLSGRPSVGRRVEVTATARASGLLANSVSAAASGQGSPVRSVSIRGTVDRVDEGEAVVVEGIRVLLSDLTKTVGSAAAGSNVRIKAELQLDGQLLAREIVQYAYYDETGETSSSPVDIEGRIERIGANGGLTVNGIPVAVSALTTIDAPLQVGTPVQVRGLLQLDGSVLAREIVGYGPGVTGGPVQSYGASVAGVVERVETGADGATTGFVIDGIAIATDQLTRLEVELTIGVAVVVQAIVINGEILAVTVEPRPTGSIGSLPLVQMQGTVERPINISQARPLDITVNGITVRISGSTTITGELRGGAVVKVTGSISGNVFLAREIETVVSYPAQAGQSQVRFNLSGEIEEIRTDSEGEPESLTLSGNTITIVSLTVFQDEVAVGDQVAVEGIIRDSSLLAALVKLYETSTDSEDGATAEFQ